MKRCAQCHGQLGLGVRSRKVWNGRWWVHMRYCSVHCEALHELERYNARASRAGTPSYLATVRRAEPNNATSPEMPPVALLAVVHMRVRTHAWRCFGSPTRCRHYRAIAVATGRKWFCCDDRLRSAEFGYGDEDVEAKRNRAPMRFPSQIFAPY